MTRHRAIKIRAPAVDGLTYATGPDGLKWSRWAIETEEQFRARVREDAERLGVRYYFETPGGMGRGGGGGNRTAEISSTND